MIETERKFLATGSSALKLWTQAAKLDAEMERGKADHVQRLDQGYLIIKPNIELRIRSCGACGGKQGGKPDARIALKVGNGLHRHEFEYHIPMWLFDFLWAYARGFHKTRFDVGGWSVDFFDGCLSGLMLAEHESPNAMNELPPLPKGLVLAEEVTNERTFANKNLAKLSCSERGDLVYERVR